MNPWMILGVVLAVGAAYGTGHYQGDAAGQERIQAKWDRERAEQLAQHAADQAKAREKERALQARADKLRQEKDLEIRAINARADALAGSLRDRPTRAAAETDRLSTTAGAGPAGPGCTGSTLPREDAEFLAGEAARADQLRVALRQCLDQYETLKH